MRSDRDIRLAHDVEIKIRILDLANQLRLYELTQSTRIRRAGGTPRLAKIGLEFMNLCTIAAHKVSEARWFDIGARLLVQAALEEQRENEISSEDLSKLCSWTPGEPARDSRWTNVRQGYLEDWPSRITGAQPPGDKVNFHEFMTEMVEFLTDLMNTLDPPILIQLERGKLGDLTHDETQQLKAQVGLR